MKKRTTTALCLPFSSSSVSSNLRCSPLFSSMNQLASLNPSSWLPHENVVKYFHAAKVYIHNKVKSKKKKKHGPRIQDGLPSFNNSCRLFKFFFPTLFSLIVHLYQFAQLFLISLYPAIATLLNKACLYLNTDHPTVVNIYTIPEQLE